MFWTILFPLSFDNFTESWIENEKRGRPELKHERLKIDPPVDFYYLDNFYILKVHCDWLGPNGEESDTTKFYQYFMEKTFFDLWKQEVEQMNLIYRRATEGLTPREIANIYKKGEIRAESDLINNYVKDLK